MRAATLIVLIASFSICCSTTVREAEPLDIEEVAPKPRHGPLQIRRAALVDVLRKGPGRFFERMPVAPYRVGRTLVGFQVVALYARANPHPDGVQVGDVVTSVNGQKVLRPEQFMDVWGSVAQADAISVDILRQSQRRTVVYRIVD